MLDTAACLLFMGFGIYGARRSYRELKHTRAGRSWPHTPGVIITSNRRVEKDAEGETESAFILYFYEVKGVPYRSARVFSGDVLGLGFRRAIRRYMAAYPAGKPVKVFYNPEAPDTAFLEPGANKAAYLSFFLPLALSLWGLVALLARLLD
jgi:hypothetical protein